MIELTRVVLVVAIFIFIVSSVNALLRRNVLQNGKNTLTNVWAGKPVYTLKIDISDSYTILHFFD